MKNLIIILFTGLFLSSFGQLDTDQLSLDISKADAANIEALKAFIWKKQSVVTVDGVEKLTVLNEISIDEDGNPNIRNLDADTDVKQKRGLRGKAQMNAAGNKLDYAEKAIELGMQYTYMSKGQLLDFFDKAEISEKDGIIEATGKDLYMEGDMLSVQVDAETKLFLSKKFSSIMDGDPISGEVNYKKFTSGLMHVSKSSLALPAKQAVINSENMDYLQRVQ